MVNAGGLGAFGVFLLFKYLRENFRAMQPFPYLYV
jgi:hypothetical protein